MFDCKKIIEAILDGSINNKNHPIWINSKRKPQSIEVVWNEQIIQCYLITGPVIEDEGPEVDATLFRLIKDLIDDEKKVELYTKTVLPYGKTILPVARLMYLEAWGLELKPRTIMRIPGEYGSFSF